MKIAIIVMRVASSQICKRVGNNLVPLVLDKHVMRNDHVSFYRDMLGMHSWSQKGAGVKSK